MFIRFVDFFQGMDRRRRVCIRKVDQRLPYSRVFSQTLKNLKNRGTTYKSIKFTVLYLQVETAVFNQEDMYMYT